ncbi:unnamed protein product [Lymnaea stagnalis]|uniref:Smr domain-containing protein n=1 Tax=Lymnaea stagnalis TaxID=6523 RepID=A0AAV2I6K4_LYMST
MADTLVYVIIGILVLLSFIGFFAYVCCYCNRKQKVPYQRHETDVERGLPWKRQQGIVSGRKLDLHNLSVNDAMLAFTKFIQEKDFEYGQRKQDPFIFVITGRGKHSPDGIPKIKPSVQSYLDKNRYKYTWANPGMVKIDLSSRR